MLSNEQEKKKALQELCRDLGIEWDNAAEQFSVAGVDMTLDEVISHMTDTVKTTEPTPIDQLFLVDQDELLINGCEVSQLEAYHNIKSIAA